MYHFHKQWYSRLSMLFEQSSDTNHWSMLWCALTLPDDSALDSRPGRTEEDRRGWTEDRRMPPDQPLHGWTFCLNFERKSSCYEKKIAEQIRIRNLVIYISPWSWMNKFQHFFSYSLLKYFHLSNQIIWLCGRIFTDEPLPSSPSLVRS